MYFLSTSKIGILKIPIKAMSIRFLVFLTRTDSFLSCKIRPSIRSSHGMQVRFFLLPFLAFRDPKSRGNFVKVSAAEKNNISLFLLKKGEVIEVEKEENTTFRELWMELCSCGHKNHNQLLGKPIFFCVIKHVKSDF